MKMTDCSTKTRNKTERKSRWSAAGTATALAFLILGALTVMAQDRPIRPETLRRFPEADTIKLPPARATLNHALLDTNTKPALAFRPFDLVDPKTNKPIAPTATITLPNGKKPTAKQYYDELNTFEKWLTDHGYSLRTTKKGTQIKLHDVRLDRVRLERQLQMAPRATTLSKRADFLAVYSDKNLSSVQPLRLSTSHVAMARIPTQVQASQIDQTNRQIASAGLRGVQRDGLVISTDSLAQIARMNSVTTNKGAAEISSSRVATANTAAAKQAEIKATEEARAAALAKELAAAKAAGATNCKPVTNNRNWNWDVGDPGTFHAYVNGTLTLSGQACKPPDMQKFDTNQSHFNVSAEAKAGGSVFGAGGELLRATANLGGTQTTHKVNAGLGIFVLGQNILNLNRSVDAHLGIEDKIGKGVDFSTSLPIPVGPFDIDVTVGARGEAGFEYSMSLYPMSISLSGGPFVHTSVYAQGGLNVVVAEAGVGVSLTLVNWDMNLGGSAGVGWLFAFYVYDDVYADSTLNLLSGNVYVYAKVYYPCLDPFPDICDSQFQTNLWSYPGYQFNSVLFDEKNVIPLGW